MFIDQLEQLSPDQLFDNFDRLTRLRYTPGQELVKRYSTARTLKKFFQKYSRKQSTQNSSREGTKKKQDEFLRLRDKYQEQIIKNMPLHLKFSLHDNESQEQKFVSIHNLSKNKNKQKAYSKMFASQEDKENNRNFCNMVKISDYELKEPVRKRKSTASKLLLNSSTRDISTSIFGHSKKQKLSVPTSKVFNQRSSSNPKPKVPNFNSKKSLVEYSHLIQKPSQGINMSKRSSTAAHPYGIDLSRREIVKMFKQGVCNTSVNNHSKSKVNRSMKASKSHKRTNLSILRRCLKGTEQSSQSILPSYNNFNLQNHYQEYNSSMNTSNQFKVRKGDTSKITRSRFLNRSVDEQSISQYQFNLNHSKHQRSRSIKMKNAKSFITLGTNQRKKSTDIRKKQKPGQVPLSKSRAKTHRNLKSLGQMMKMKNSSKNLLNRINSKLGYLDKIEIHQNAYKNAKLGKGSKSKNEMKFLPKYLRMKTEASEDKLRGNLSIKDINLSIKQLQQANAAGIFYRKEPSKSKREKSLSLVAQLDPSLKRLASVLGGEKRKKHDSKPSSTYKFEFGNGFISTREGVPRASKKGYLNNMTKKSKLSSFLRKQQKSRTRRMSSVKSSTKNINCIYNNILKSYMNH